MRYLLAAVLLIAACGDDITTHIPGDECPTGGVGPVVDGCPACVVTCETVTCRGANSESAFHGQAIEDRGFLWTCISYGERSSVNVSLSFAAATNGGCWRLADELVIDAEQCAP